MYIRLLSNVKSKLNFSFCLYNFGNVCFDIFGYFGIEETFNRVPHAPSLSYGRIHYLDKTTLQRGQKCSLT